MSPESRLRFELTMETILERIARWARASCCAARPGRTRRFASARAPAGARPRDGGNLLPRRLRQQAGDDLRRAGAGRARRARADDDLSACLGYPSAIPAFRMRPSPCACCSPIPPPSATRELRLARHANGCTLRELLENADNWLPARPGEAFHYTNLGAGVAGAAMERAANRPFDDIMQELVFAPLAIRASYVPWPHRAPVGFGQRLQHALPHPHPQIQRAGAFPGASPIPLTPSAIISAPPGG